MKIYKPKEITQPTEAPQPRLYTWDEVKSNEGVYKIVDSVCYLITLKENLTNHFATLWYSGKRLEPAQFVWEHEEKFQKLENAKVIFDVIEG